VWIVLYIDAQMAARLPIFIHGWKKPSLLAKLVYREDDVIFIAVNTEVQFHNFSNVSSRLC